MGQFSPPKTKEHFRTSAQCDLLSSRLRKLPVMKPPASALNTVPGRQAIQGWEVGGAGSHPAVREVRRLNASRPRLGRNPGDEVEHYLMAKLPSAGTSAQTLERMTRGRNTGPKTEPDVPTAPREPPERRHPTPGLA